MKFLEDSWLLFVNEKEQKVLEHFDKTLKDLGHEASIYTEGTPFGILIKEFRVKNFGKILVYDVGKKTAIEVPTREGTKKILNQFLKNLGKKPYSTWAFEEKKRWKEILGE